MGHPASAGAVGVTDLVHGENACAFFCFKQDAMNQNRRSWLKLSDWLTYNRKLSGSDGF
jgi:hypothetical protein